MIIIPVTKKVGFQWCIPTASDSKGIVKGMVIEKGYSLLKTLDSDFLPSPLRMSLKPKSKVLVHMLWGTMLHGRMSGTNKVCKYKMLNVK